MSVSPQPASSHVYLYCIVPVAPFKDGTPPIRAAAIGTLTETVRIVPYDDLAAVVSDAPAAQYDVSRRNMLAHQLVIEEVMRRTVVLPVRFSTVAKSDQAIKEQVLRRKAGEFHQLLRYLRGRTESGLKVFWEREPLFRSLVAEHSELRALRDSIAGRSVEETHYERIQIGQLTDEAIRQQRQIDADLILDALSPLAVEMRLNKTLTDMMVLNAAFLVETAREEPFEAKLRELDGTHAGVMSFKYVGPVPPYNFVNISVHWEE
jgi:Gas vesicle synthesis protein GvpL/GvpF